MKRYVQEIPELECVLLAIDRTAWDERLAIPSSFPN